MVELSLLKAVVGTVAKRRGYNKAFRKPNEPNGQSDVLVPTSESWHTESAKAALVSFVTTPDSLPREQADSLPEALRRLPSTKAMIMRDDRQITTLAEELVPSDIVLLQQDDKVPADLQLFRVKGLQAKNAPH